MNAGEQPPAATVAGYLGVGHQRFAAGPKYSPHLLQRSHLEIRRQVMHDQAGHHDVEVLGRELQRFDRADLEQAIAEAAGATAGVRDHLSRWIDPNDRAIRADRLCEQAREVARAARDIQHALDRLDACGGD